MNELNKSFVYLYGETTDIQEAKQFLATAKSKGYTTAFIVPFKNGQKINLQEALKL
jgi:N-acetylmuramoyl-L-alanine amidase